MLLSSSSVFVMSLLFHCERKLQLLCAPSSAPTIARYQQADNNPNTLRKKRQ